MAVVVLRNSQATETAATATRPPRLPQPSRSAAAGPGKVAPAGSFGRTPRSYSTPLRVSTDTTGITGELALGSGVAAPRVPARKRFRRKVETQMRNLAMNRLTSLLVLWSLAVLLTASATAQEDLPSPYWHHFEPDVPVGDLQLFSSRDLSTYGSGPQPNTGFFFTYDLMRMSMSPADRAPIGIVTEVIPRLLDTGQLLSTEWRMGNRFEGGWMQDDNRGILFSGFKSKSFSDRIFMDQTAIAIFDPSVVNRVVLDPPFFQVLFPANPVFNSVFIRPKTRVWGGEAMRTWRFDRQPVPFFPVFEFMLGARYMDVRDDFLMNAGFGIDPAAAQWATRTHNRMIGPQLGLRAVRQNGPWALNVEGRFFSAFNYQNVRHRSRFSQPLYNALLAPMFPGQPVPAFPTASNDSEHEVEWAPTIEMRIEWNYVVSRAIALRVGVYGTYIAQGIVRASNKVDYSNLAPVGGSTSRLLPGNNDQDLLTWGPYFGVEINR